MAMEFVGLDAGSAGQLADLWTRALGDGFALSERALRYSLTPSLDARQAGQLVLIDQAPAAFVLASVLDGHAGVAPPDMGWLDALVVPPEFRGRGLGSQLLAWAEEWLKALGKARVRLGGGLRPFAPGVAREWDAEFFRKRGFVPRAEDPVVQDFGRELQTYTTPPFVRTLDVVCRPATFKDVNALTGFYAREFPGRWMFEFEQHVRDGARLSDYWLLESERGLDACCVMTLEDSLRPIERYYPFPLPRPWGQVGTVGVSADRRNAGYGSALLDATLRQMRDAGVRGCIIDWTHHVGYYERFGFAARRGYEMMIKTAKDEG